MKKHTGLIVALVLICIAAAAGGVKALDMYRNTHQKLNDILTYSEMAAAPTEPETASTPAAEPASTSLTLSVNGEAITIDLTAPGSTYECSTLNTEFETSFATDDTSHEIAINGEVMTDGTANVKLPAIKKGTNISVDVDGQAYYLRTLPEDFPPLTAIGQGAKEGYYYTTMGNFVVKFDTKGEVVFYRKANATNAGPFRRNEIDGEVIYSYLEAYGNPYHNALSGIGYRTTALVMLNEQYEKINEIPYMVPTEKVPENYPLENHDYQILGKDHYILTTYVGKKADNIPSDVEGHEYGANVVACIFQEVKDGECIFEWDSTDHPELYGASLEAGDYTNESRIWSDYVHFNAIVIDPKDNNFLCSYRDLDAVLKIDRETGDIIWTLGGVNDDFGLTDEQLFHRQHNVTLTDEGDILLFDNGCLTNILGYPVQSDEEKAAAASQYSRGVRFTLDEEELEVTDFQEYRFGGFYSASMGSAQLIDHSTDTILMGWGGKSKAGMPLFSEFSTQTETVNFEMLCGDSEINCYRVTFFEK